MTKHKVTEVFYEMPMFHDMNGVAIECPECESYFGLCICKLGEHLLHCIPCHRYFYSKFTKPANYNMNVITCIGTDKDPWADHDEES